MRNVNSTILSATDAASQNSSQIDANQLVSASFHAYFGDTHAAGTFKLQVSNDICASGYNAVSNFTVTNWVDLPTATASIASGGAAIISVPQMCYRWVRAAYTNSTTYKQVQTISTVADVAGSLNSTYFTLSSVNTLTNAEKDFYVWYDNGSGVDPAVPGKTGIHVAYSNNASANTLATLTRAALNALTNDFVATGATNAIIATNVNPGAVPAAADGTAATGFGFANTTPGVNATTITVNMNALSL